MRYALTIGFITYGKSTAKYLPYFLSSLKNQTFKEYNIISFDNTENFDNENIDYIKNNYPGIEILRAGENIGFARAYNKMIGKAVEAGAEYFLAINPDIILEPDAVEKMVKTMDSDGALGSVCPKILRFYLTPQPPLLNSRGGVNFEVKKTNIIDTCGIQLKPGLRFIDARQGQIDYSSSSGQAILGPSGAAAMYRIDALNKVKQGDEYFDELMFMYKEDCDLAYRLFLAGFQSKCVNGAIVYHDRTARAKGESNLQVALNRKNKNKQIKKWSFLGQQIIFVKYWKQQNFWNKSTIAWHEIKMLIFILLFEQYLFGQYWKLWKIKKNINIYKKG